MAFYLLDHLDYLPAAWIVFAGMSNVTTSRVVVSNPIVFLAHHLASVIGYSLRMRGSIHRSNA